MEDILKILFVEDVKIDAELMWKELNKNNIKFSKRLTENKIDYLAGLGKFKPDIIVSDYSLPQFDGMTALKLRNDITPETPFILVTGSNNETIAVECMKAGADDYILKDNLSRLAPAINSSVNKIKLLREKNAMKAALRESEVKYRKIFENVHDVFYESSFDGTILEITPSIEILSKGQYLRNDVIGKSVFDFYNDPFDREDFIRELREKGNVIDYEIKFSNRDGSLLICSISSRIMFDDNGCPECIIGCIRDITERRTAEKLLRESHEFRDSLLKTIPFGMDIVDTSGTIKYLNANLGRNFNEDVIGKKCWKVYCDTKTQCIDCPLIKGISIGETQICESQGVFGGRIFEIFHTGILYDNKKAVLEIFQDITERKTYEKNLMIAKEKAEESDRLKSAFLANMSHEIRTPMNGILGFAELLKEPRLSGEEQKEYIGLIEKSGVRMLNIINDIIDISKIESGLIKVETGESNINEQIDYLYTFFKPESESKGIQLTMKNSLPSNGSIIKTDREKVFAILTNLIKNAIKYSSKGTIEFGYTLVETLDAAEKRLHATSLQFFVKDQGIGIPRDRQDAIFDRFIQAEIADRNAYQGAGLGLAIAKSYVEMLGGKIWVESELGEGSTFYFTLPYKNKI